MEGFLKVVGKSFIYFMLGLDIFFSEPKKSFDAKCCIILLGCASSECALCSVA